MTLYFYLFHLKQKGVKILHVLLLDDKHMKEEDITRYRSEMEAPGRFEVVVQHVPHLTKQRSWAWSSMRPVEASDEVRQRVNAFAPHAIFSLDVFGASIFSGGHPAPLLVQMHDPAFQTLWYHALYALREEPLRSLQACVNLGKAFLWRGYYRRVLKAADRVICVAKSSESALRSIGIEARYVPMAWPQVGSRTALPALPATPTFLFLGNLSGLGSRSALHFLLFQAYPSMKKAWGSDGFQVYICGANTLPPWVVRAITGMPEIRFLGFVDDLESLMLSCHGVLAPIDVPVGNRTRILSAASLGVPVVAHSNTALGNPDLVDGVSCYLADEPVAFVERMRRCVERGVGLDQLLSNARRMYETKFAPEAATDLLLQEIDAMLTSGR